MGWSRSRWDRTRRPRRYQAAGTAEWWEMLDRRGNEVVGGFGVCGLCRHLGHEPVPHRWECDRCGARGHVDGPRGLSEAAMRLLDHLRHCDG